MQATKNNSTGECQRCGRFGAYTLATGFNEDGSFRFLCLCCDRIERDRHQRKLFADVAQAARVFEVVAEPEVIEEVVVNAQMSLF